MNLRPDLAKFVEEWKLRKNVTRLTREEVFEKEEQETHADCMKFVKKRSIRKTITRLTSKEIEYIRQYCNETLSKDKKRSQTPQRSKCVDIIIDDPSIWAVNESELNNKKEDAVMKHIRDD